MAAYANRIDPLSWAIFISQPAPPQPTEELWSNPWFYPVMRPILHESLHFWHSISTKQGIYLAFDCLKSLNALRFAARRGTDLRALALDWTFDGYRPFELLARFTAADARNIPSTFEL